MSVSSLFASQAYSQMGQVPKTGLEGGDVAKASAGQGTQFGAMVTDYLSQAIDTGKAGEEMAKQSVQGQADMIDVVTAISAAETTLETVVAVRDKVIEAYESIIRMPI